MGNTSSESEHQEHWTTTTTTTTKESQEEQFRSATNWSCVSQLEEDQWNSATVIASFIILGLINIMVIVGNTLVIMAVFLSEKLRTVTNLFIVSLAVSDLMVGLAVLPFSTANEVLGVWVFGNIWCEVWLAVDVWMCTASILNLCAISLDRYLAVTRPVSYPSIMSSKRAKILITLVWCVSFVICFPPLVGWNDSRQQGVSSMSSSPTLFSASGASTRRTERSTSENKRTKRSLLSFLSNDIDSLDSNYYNDDAAVNFTVNDVFESVEEIAVYFSDNFTNTSGANVDDYTSVNNESAVPCQCQLIADKGYRIYSALGSFYLPMFVMMFFYWRIYRAAIETTRAINQGFRTTKSMTCGIGGRFEEQRLTLRIHRGRSSNDLYAKSNGNCESSTTNVSFRAGSRVRNSSLRETKSSDVASSGGGGGMTFPPHGERKMRGLHISRHRSTTGSSSSKSSSKQLVNGSKKKTGRRRWPSGSQAPVCDLGSPPLSTATTTAIDVTTNPLSSYHQVATTTVTTTTSGGSATVTTIPSMTKDPSDVDAATVAATNDDDTDKRGPQLFSKMGKRNIKAQVKRFRTETKAAKTLGIIVGGFILCWLPFFTLYLIGAFCVDECIPESLFAVAFWLGYCNSAINPCVYALFSRDFRNAFKRILCRCFMPRDHSVKERIVTMFPATFQLASFFEESEDGSNSH